jgi:hypothetical protein
MAAGLPIVATNVGGVPEIVKNGQSGFLVAGDDTKAQITLIARLVRDSALRARIGMQARTYVEQNHSVHRLSAHLAGLYEAAFSRTRTRKSHAAPITPGSREAAVASELISRDLIKEEEVYEH